MTQEEGARIWGCQAEAGAQLCPLSRVFVHCIGNLLVEQAGIPVLVVTLDPRLCWVSERAGAAPREARQQLQP